MKDKMDMGLIDSTIKELPQTLKDKLPMFGEDPLPLKVALLGPSGSGKTTLATALTMCLGIPFISTSAGEILPKVVKEHLRNKYGWLEDGHKNVIKLSHADPCFGRDFQTYLLHERASIIYNNPKFIMDRSPIDNVSYMLDQVGYSSDEAYIDAFISKAQKAYIGLTHVIFLKSAAPKIEDNKSRIANRFYQRMSTAIFEHVKDTYFAGFGMKDLTLQEWDFTEKLNKSLQFLLDPK